MKGKAVLICYYKKVSYIVNSKINLIPKRGVNLQKDLKGGRGGSHYCCVSLERGGVEPT